MFRASNNANESVLGQQYRGLRATNTSYWNEASHNKSLNVVPEKEVAPVTPEDVDTLVATLMGCPTGRNALRVFQQHDAGLCWQDSFFIMLYNQDWYQPTLEEHIRFYMDEFFRSGETDLTYAKEIEEEMPNISTWNSKTYSYTGTKKEMVAHREAKIKPVALAFKRRHGFGLPLKFWEYLCLNLHRYILLGYLFMKNPNVMNQHRKNQPSQMFRRRMSIGHNNYSKLHTNYKEYVLGMLEIGMHCYNFQQLKVWLLGYIKNVSGGRHGFLPFDVKDVDTTKIDGYYIALTGKHIISLFKCGGGTWYMYDIDIGCKDFSAEDSAKLSASRLSGLLLEKQGDEFVYRFYLEDKSSVGMSLPFVRERGLKYDGIVIGTSFIMAETGAPAAAVNAPATSVNANTVKAANGHAGGRRRTIRKRRSVRKTRHV